MIDYVPPIESGSLALVFDEEVRPDGSRIVSLMNRDTGEIRKAIN